MGKKKVAKQDQEKLIKESEAVDATAAKKAGESTKQRLEMGRVYIQASFNNTMITVTDSRGGVVAWMSAGSLGFSGPKKATPFAASKVAEAIAEKVKKSGPSTVEVFVRGVGKGRDSAVRTLATKGFNITAIRDMTPIPHNGPRPKKVRRV
jgi:small subunit ribosomal protein S11